MIGKLLGGENWALQSYVEMAYPDQIQKDTRSAQQIKDDILRHLKTSNEVKE